MLEETDSGSYRKSEGENGISTSGGGDSTR